ncbi:GNAT family N-acetyltransferase [Chitinophaga arvensicola]|uniref:Ribosomal-protein-alanine N-acetyltransferase n=1 Tax=Chitinophaga arvensicola TaxID=29529 RepID=A0A1I0Q4A5_9BACT|nr:GNAT family N-acetyltransferase [Chitinophaga arvensicola]SEW21803.1 ribosomal-protein-alanine N-acetyltransferase [Chitinophaga arvensicola]
MLTLHFNPFPTLVTQRFVLRSPALYDDEAMAILRSDPIVNQYLHRKTPTTVADARKFIDDRQADNAAGRSFYWIITTKESDHLVGTICFWNIEPELERAEIGYELQAAFFGKGIMQEVLPAVILFGFEQVHLQKITAFPFAGNERSVKLLERYQFTLDQPLRESLEKEDDLTDILCYSIEKPA